MQEILNNYFGWKKKVTRVFIRWKYVVMIIAKIAAIHIYKFRPRQSTWELVRGCEERLTTEFWTKGEARDENFLFKIEP